MIDVHDEAWRLCLAEAYAKSILAREGVRIPWPFTRDEVRQVLRRQYLKDIRRRAMPKGKSAKKYPTSQAQSRLMFAAAQDAKVAKRTGVPQDVAEEYVLGAHGTKVGQLPEKVRTKGKK